MRRASSHARGMASKTTASQDETRKSPASLPGFCVLAVPRGSALLDRREQPVAAANAAEGPHFGGFLRRFVALGRLAGSAIDVLILERVTHGDAGVFLVALAPRFGEIA